MKRTIAIVLTGLFLTLALADVASAQTATAGLMRLLKSGKIPAERQPQIIGMVCERGDADDLAYIFSQATEKDGFTTAAVRAHALDALADAALTRKVKPSGDLTTIGKLIETNDKDAKELRAIAIRLAGLWKLQKATAPLEALAVDPKSDDALRQQAIDALTAISGKGARATIDKLSAKGQPQSLRYLGVAALTKISIDEAAAQAAAVLAEGTDRDDPTALISAFFDQKVGPEKLTGALTANPPPRDVARLALRSMFAIGRNYQPLAEVLQKAAGILAEVKPVTGDALSKMVAEVAARGDAKRGEKIIRRADLSCLKCHAISKAGGDIGPDLSAVGSISPADFIINSIMVPEMAVKENFIMTTVVTNDGRVFQGIVTEKGSQRWTLKDATGKLITIAKSDIDEEETKEGGSLMPKGLANLMAEGEFLDLVRFISELGKPGPYAIRSQPAIQRWRVLKNVPAKLADAVPDSAALKAEVLDAADDAFAPAYGYVSGDLPLADFLPATGKSVLYLYGEVEVEQTGELELIVTAPAKTVVWWNDKSLGEGTKFKLQAEEGTHKIVLRVPPADAASSASVKVEFAKPAKSAVEFTPVGGK